ncbi:MAG: hypothetical protein ABI981_10785 [Betaproteobacteria bacterium]
MDHTVAPGDIPLPDPVRSAVEPASMHQTVSADDVPHPDPTHSSVELPSMDPTVSADDVPHPDPIHSAVAPREVDQTTQVDTAVTSTRLRRRPRIAVLASLLAATAIVAYFYYDRSSPQIAAKNSAAPPAASVADSAVAKSATPTVASQVDAASAQNGTAPPSGIVPGEAEQAPSRGASVAERPRTDPEPVRADPVVSDLPSVSRPAALPPADGIATNARQSSATRPGMKTRPASPISKECTEAVATLGFCGPGDTQGEK